MAVSPPDLAILSRLLDIALGLGADERASWLDALPEPERHLGPLLREMLVEHDRARTSGFLSSMPPLDPGAGGDGATAETGEVVGAYRLLREIGRGGMGEVWLAERADGAFRRQVALKLPRLAWGAGLGQRMAREREIGALLEHPNIARLYDAGVDERGRPYIALEYIDGEPIDTWCARHALRVRDRLQLFVQVVRAVSYAHSRLVVHRDLKPSNVLVTPDGQAHLLDFGIAKRLQDAAAMDDRLTQEQGRVLTPHYASPEQVAGTPITVQSDVYSLGVLLYELLTGALPFTPRRGSPGAVEEAILQGDAAPASSKAKDRATANALRGDVDAILAKAMQRELVRRYATADALATDIERHLQGETVIARPDGMAYRLSKALRRHRVGVAATSAVVLAVIAGSGVAAVQAQRAARSMERERVVKEFVSEVLRVGGQRVAASPAMRSAPADAFLERSTQLVQSRFAGEPALQADLYAMVGTVFADMGASHLAIDCALRRIEALTAAGAAPAEQARALLQLAAALLDQRRFEDAEQRALRAGSLAEDDADLLLRSRVIVARSLAARDRLASLEAELRTIDAAVARAGPGAAVPAAWALGLHATLLMAGNRRADAMPLLHAAIDHALVAEGPDSATAIELRLMAAQASVGAAATADAERFFDAAVASLRRRGTEGEIRAAYEIARFAAYRYRNVDQVSAHEAMKAIADARTMMSNAGRVLPAELTAGVDFFDADVLSWSGRITAGMAAAERAFVVLYPQAASPSERRQLAFPFGRVLAFSGRHELADHWLREALKAEIEAGRGRHPYAAGDYMWVALNLSMQGRHDEALAFLDTAPPFPPVADEAGGGDHYSQEIKLMRSRVLIDAGKASQALLELPRALLTAPGAEDRREALTISGQALCESGQTAPGLAALREVMAIGEKDDDDENAPWTAWLRAETGLCALRHGDRKYAATLALRARATFHAQPEVSPYYKWPLLQLERALGLNLPPV